MNETLATYSFLPWLRQGIATSIRENDGDSGVKLRASIEVNLRLKVKKPDGTEYSPDDPSQTVSLYGPGDIEGIDSRAVVKHEPQSHITNFEPNYLPFIEFYDEDFAWRYTPARPGGQRLRPWIALVVLKEDEFELDVSIGSKPLPSVILKGGVKTAGVFPPPSEMWAWAHVHVNTDLLDDAALTDEAREDVAAGLQDVIRENPDNACCRIISPRKLVENTGYRAFLVPVFESGRLAGLGEEVPGSLTATESAWEDPATKEFPYYYSWYFRTGNMGDFEYLVNLLKPMPADKSVGIRDMDVLHIGSNLPNIEDDPGETDESALLGGVLKLGGALRVPLKEPDEDSSEEEISYYNEVKKYDEWDENPYPHPFVEAMAKRINLADDYVSGTSDTGSLNTEAGIPKVKDQDGIESNDPDPVITSPLYGRWHALTQRLLHDRTGNTLPANRNWIHELNLDPRFRVAAGFGTKVVQKNQEEYMHAAWKQVGDIVEANNRIRFAQMAREISSRFYARHLLPLDNEKAFVFASPVTRRVVYNGFTIQKQVEESTLPLAVTTGSFRKLVRPGGRMMKKLPFSSEVSPGNLLNRINEGKVTAAPPKGDPLGAIRIDDVAGTLKPEDAPSFLIRWLKRHPWLRHIPLVLLILLLIIAILFSKTLAGIGIPTAVIVLLILLYRKIIGWHRGILMSDRMGSQEQKPEAVDSMPKRPDFRITGPGSDFSPSGGSADSAEASRFKQGLKEAYIMAHVSFPAPDRKMLDFKGITGKLVSALNPALTIPKRVLGAISIPARIIDNMAEKFTPVMAYPEIDIPMYKPLTEISADLFLPNINKLKDNSITLLETNAKFIESYLAGLNHEMSRELLWREYPTDQRGTCFRQFWDVTGYLPPQPVPDDIRERLRDIPPMHRWPLRPVAARPGRNELGSNNQRAESGEDAQIVLVIRGELLKKYPTAVVYAHRADWGEDSNGVQKITEERVFAGLTDAEKKDPPRTKVKTPLYEAKVEPDIYFFGFDLTMEEALGTENPASVNDDPGWFFVLKERPGELRFGLDIEKAVTGGGLERIINWNNLSWKDIYGPKCTKISDGECIFLNAGDTCAGLDTSVELLDYNNNLDQENKDNPEDKQAAWGPDTNSAELAYILYQVPVLVGIHASKMLD